MEIRPGPPDPDALLPLAQHPSYVRMLIALGQQAEMLRLEGADGTGTALIVTRRLPGVGRVALVTRGPVWAEGTAAATRAAGLAALRDRGLRMVEAETAEDAGPLARTGYLRVMTPAHVAELDLAQGAETLRRALDGKWRNRLVRAEAAGAVVRVAPFRPDTDAWLLEAEARQARERRYGRFASAVARAWAQANPGRAWLGRIEEAGRPIAGMLVLRHGRVATYQIGWTSEAGRALSAHHLILMELVRRLAGDGVARLDLGLVDTDGNPGLARFKIGTGAAIRPLGGSWLRLPGIEQAARLAGRRALAKAGATG